MHRTLSRRASFAVSAAIVGLALWTSGAPAITYPLYAEEWHLTTTTTTVIFALYPIALVVSLAIVGNLSDYIGRRSAMLLGVTASFIGVLLFALAPSVGWLFVGRAFMGIGVALSLSPGTAAVVEFSAPGQEKRASAIATTATAVGLALAVLVGGSLIQYAPFPTRLNFWVLLVVLAVTAAFAWFLPRHTAVEAQGRWRPRGMFVPRGIRPLFVLAALAMVGCFTLGVIQLSLGADIAKGLIGSTNAFVTGSIIAINAVAIGVSALLTRNVRPAPLIAVGGIAAVLGASSLLLSSFEHSLLIFLISAVISGAGYSLLLRRPRRDQRARTGDPSCRESLDALPRRVPVPGGRRALPRVARDGIRSRTRHRGRVVDHRRVQCRRHRARGHRRSSATARGARRYQLTDAWLS
jgi:MFS family permease